MMNMKILTPKKNVFLRTPQIFKKVPAFYRTLNLIALLITHQFSLSFVKQTHIFVRLMFILFSIYASTFQIVSFFRFIHKDHTRRSHLHHTFYSSFSLTALISSLREQLAYKL
jgi:hypothetical protein